ncbi:metallophosphoesterase [Bacillus sp. SM2101]|uniref:metallophosphoesterase n=1 Tax=Bacillus sp. SM2101 TaxID=2805366 RepID=UPI001BDE0F07|nr:metallophosphoesterase [Bacillus sp. SM2101]
MSLYCIGDLHGRYDLFTMALDKINFDHGKDKMYILGDVLNRNYGAIKIIKYIMQYPNSFEFLIGNHELHFIENEKAYDAFMLDENIKQREKTYSRLLITKQLKLGQVVHSKERNY